MNQTEFRKLLKSKNIKLSRVDFEKAHSKHIARLSRPQVIDLLVKKKRAWVFVRPYSHGDIVMSIKTTRPRIKRWCNPTSVERPNHGTVIDIADGRYSSKCTWQKIDHHPGVYSYGIAFGLYLIYRLGSKQYKIKAPKGWCWIKDEQGICIQRKDGANYHPHADELIGKNAARNCCAKARQLHSERVKLDKEKKLSKKLLDSLKDGFYVSLVDSLNAGNCLNGTSSFMRKSGLQGEHAHISAIRKLCYGPLSQRITRVIEYAEKREIKERKAGFCLLSDHQNH